MSDEAMLQEAIKAVRQGQKERARDILTRLLRQDQTNSNTWLWMSALVDKPKERNFCLQKALELDSENHAARHGLVFFGVLPPEEAVQPPIRRQWQTPLADDLPSGLRGWLTQPWARYSLIGLVGLIVVGLMLAGIFWPGRNLQVAIQPTKTPGPPPTFTPTPTFVGETVAKADVAVTPSPTFAGPTPLWALLEATYTPTPLYVNTPHPISEAYRAGQRAFFAGAWERALRFFRQASQVENFALSRGCRASAGCV